MASGSALAGRESETDDAEDDGDHESVATMLTRVKNDKTARVAQKTRNENDEKHGEGYSHGPELAAADGDEGKGDADDREHGAQCYRPRAGVFSKQDWVEMRMCACVGRRCNCSVEKQGVRQHLQNN